MPLTHKQAFAHTEMLFCGHSRERRKETEAETEMIKKHNWYARPCEKCGFTLARRGINQYEAEFIDK
jgi:hypothetical protein